MRKHKTDRPFNSPLHSTVDRTIQSAVDIEENQGNKSAITISLECMVSRGDNLRCEPNRATSRTKNLKPSNSSLKIFKLIHDKEPPDDSLSLKAA